MIFFYGHGRMIDALKKKHPEFDNLDVRVLESLPIAFLQHIFLKQFSTKEIKELEKQWEKEKPLKPKPFMPEGGLL